jgi:RNA polymerase sigma factor (sigma-70 family)
VFTNEPPIDGHDENERPPQVADVLAEELIRLRPAMGDVLAAKGHDHDDIEDIIHDAFLNVLQTAKRVEICSPVGYLRRSVINASHTLVRKKIRRRKKLGKQVKLDPAHRSFDGRAERDKAELQQALGVARDQLRNDQLQIVKLWEEGETFKRIGAEVGKPEWTVRRRFKTTCASLRRLLEAG